jgi:hypothetical protein
MKFQILPFKSFREQKKFFSKLEVFFGQLKKKKRSTPLQSRCPGLLFLTFFAACFADKGFFFALQKKQFVRGWRFTPAGQPVRTLSSRQQADRGKAPNEAALADAFFTSEKRRKKMQMSRFFTTFFC